MAMLGKTGLAIALLLAALAMLGCTAEELTLTQRVAQLRPSIAQIITPSGTGPGFAYDAKGLVVTNAHVVGNHPQVMVVLHGEEWGNNDDGQDTPPTGTFQQVSASINHTCGVKTNGQVVRWGHDGYGQAAPP